MSGIVLSCCKEETSESSQASFGLVCTYHIKDIGLDLAP